MSSNTSDNEVFEYRGNGQVVPKNVVSVVFDPSVDEIDERAFSNCKSLKEVVLNDGLKKIGDAAFARCETLESITLPSTVTDIGDASFCGCNLQSITIPSSVIAIGACSFYKCSSLKKVVLNDGSKTIATQAFYGCNSLESITIPSSMVEIGECGFDSCINLRGIVCNGVLPKIWPSTFNNCRALERITFPNLSSRLEAIIRAGQVDIQNKIQQYINRGVIEWRRGRTIHITPAEVARRSRNRWGSVQQHIRQIINWIKYYEVKEATTLFELALWKAKIDQVEDIYTSTVMLAVLKCQGR